MSVNIIIANLQLELTNLKIENYEYGEIEYADGLYELRFVRPGLHLYYCGMSHY